MPDGTRFQTPVSDEGAAAVGGALSREQGQFHFVVLTDSTLRYVHVDGAAAQWCGALGQHLVAGSARDFFAPATFARHEALDRRVMRNGNPLLSQLDLAMRADGTSQWAIISRQRMLSDGAQYVATTGRLIGEPVRPSLASLTEAMRGPFDEDTPLSTLATRAGIPITRLEEDAREEFELSLSRLVTKLRLDRALQMLDARWSLGEAAKACGYATQSALSRRFHAVSGMSPTEFHRFRSKASLKAVETSNSARQAPSPAYPSR